MDDKAIHQNEICLRACDLDIANRWKPSAILTAAQESGELHANVLGCGHARMVQNGNFFILVRLRLQMFRYPHFLDTVRITTWPGAAIRTIFSRYHRFEDTQGTELGHMSALWMICDIESRKILTPEQGGVSLPEKLCPDVFEPPEKLIFPKDAQTVENIERVCQYSDIDYNVHMNNARYADWVCDLFDPRRFETQSLSELQINFVSELKTGDAVHLSLCEKNGAYGIQGQKHDDTKNIIFQAKASFMQT